MSDTRLARPTKSDSALAAATPLSRLVEPFRTLRIPGQTIHYLLKVGAKQSQWNDRRPDPEVARLTAMLTFNHGKETFNLYFYPLGGEDPQVHMGLPMTDLAQACSDLAAAGFQRAEPAPPVVTPGLALESSQKQGQIACNSGGQTPSPLALGA